MLQEPQFQYVFMLSPNIWIYSPEAELFNQSVDSSTTEMCHLNIIEFSQVPFQKFKNLKKKNYSCNANIYFNHYVYWFV